ncbi:MAG: hypothetical protein ACI8WB_000985 [Phenylobacterium sp.]|jgi:hypothetical protein
MSIEKRIKALRTDDTLRMLNSAQNFALGEYSHGSCELAFLRDTEDGDLAVLKVKGRLITINRRGMLDEDPNIEVRA